MGYECILHYHEEISKGEYNRDETKTKSIKIGSPYDDVSLEILAGKIMAQLARRNMLIVDVEIFEFAKKKLSYKETEDGILIKNKKFGFDDDQVIYNSLNVSSSNEESDFTETTNTPSVNVHTQRTISPDVTPANANINISPKKVKPLRYEIFQPADAYLMNIYKSKKMPYTLNKRYPIFSETPAGPDFRSGMNYLTRDDNDVERTVNDKYFTPIVNLSGFEDSNEDQDIRLSGNFIEDQQIILRK